MYLMQLRDFLSMHNSDQCSNQSVVSGVLREVWSELELYKQMIFEHVIIIMRKLMISNTHVSSMVNLPLGTPCVPSENIKNIFHWTKLLCYCIWWILGYFFCPAYFLMKTYYIARTDLLPWDRDTHRRVCLWKRTPCRQHWYHIPFLCMGLIQRLCIRYGWIVEPQDFDYKK